MKKIYLTILLIVLAVSFACAQQPPVTVKGHVINQQTGAPIAGQTMFVMVDSVNSASYFKTITDETGLYSFNFPFVAGTNQGLFTVYTNDCNGSVVSGTGTYIPGDKAITIDFSICGNSQSGCEAAFKYLPLADNILQVAFYDGSRYESGSGKISYTWSFGDSATSTEQNPVHAYTQKGTYNVCLSIKSDDGLCSSIYCLPVEIGSWNSDPCDNYFKYYSDSTKNEYIFEGIGMSGKADTWTWDFGDGTTAKGQRVSHAFAGSNANYTICLTTTGTSTEGTTCTSTSCQDLYTYVPSPCESSFWYQTDSSGSAYTFQGWSNNNQVSSWNWDFGDGTTATGQTVTHLFADKKAMHTVCLNTTGLNSDSTSCTFSSCQYVYTYKPSPCESSFWYQPDSSAIGFIFEGYAKNNQITSWTWDFGDGTTATGQKVTHSFGTSTDATADHYVCLTTTATGTDGVACTFTSCQGINIYIPSRCENYFNAYTQDGSNYTFSGAVASGEPANYFWDFGDGTTATGQVATHIFTNTSPTPVPYNSGTAFNVCLTTIASDPTVNDTCKSISCQMIFVGIDSSVCKAAMTAVNDSSKNTYRFFNLSQSSYTYFNWDFGDGSRSAEANPVHTYTSPGLYFACLTIADTINNCKDQACQEIWVDMIQPDCQASFTYLPADWLSSTTFGYMFYNTSAPGYTNLKWSFGDGTGSTELSPIHVYDLPGVYSACLTIWDSLGKCQSSYCMDIFVGKIVNDNSVSGIVLAGNKVASKALVWLVSPENNYNAELLIDSTGIFNFTGVPYGKYYIYAMLTPGADNFFAYMPTYYANSLSWQGATLILTGEPNAWYAVNLIPSMARSQGDATIAGTINWGPTTAKAKFNAAAANVEVVLYNSAGNPIAYTFTDSNGSYIFENLPYGDYAVQAEMTGRSSQSIVVKLTENSTIANIDFMVNDAAINMTGITELNKTALLAGSPYPNPVSDILNIRLNALASGTAVADIMDVQGRVIQSETIALTGGNTLITIATGSLTKGVYLLRINSDGYKPVMRKFIK
jgi:PKD repeat protein